MRNFTNIYVLFLVLTLLTGCKLKTKSLENEKDFQSIKGENPNFLIIHVDDLGYHDLSITGSKIYQTPNIDNLAKESVRFTNAYANYPRCVPSRFAMLTAEFPIKDGDVPDDGFEMTGVPDSKNYIKTISNAGYQTAYFGKWHLGPDPKEFGFDTSVGAGHAGSPISFIYPFNTPKHKGISKKAPIEDLDTIGKQGDYLTDLLTDQVIKYIKERDKNKPFMAMLSFYAVHQPLEAKEDDIKRNQLEIAAHNYGNQPEFIFEGTGRTKMRQNHATYAAMVENMDRNVGKLIQLLHNEGITNNTVVIFSSDNGGLSNDGTNKRDLATSNFPLRAGKGWLYDGGIKIPLFIKWNGKFIPREEKESIIMLMDLFPTISDIITGKYLSTDGKSFLPVIESKENWKNRTLFWHSSKARPVNTGDSKSSAIRKGNYKLINWYEENRTELYNIALDPSESNNLSTQMPELTSQLLLELNQWKANF
jgi:arylsulfatase A-like enzyme